MKNLNSHLIVWTCKKIENDFPEKILPLISYMNELIIKQKL